jgi:hypothetical protein
VYQEGEREGGREEGEKERGRERERILSKGTLPISRAHKGPTS